MFNGYLMGLLLGKFFQSGGGSGGISGFANETITNGGTITSVASGIQYRPVSGDGGAVTVASAPFGTSISWQNGTAIVLRGTSNTNTVTIGHNDVAGGTILNGTMVLGLNDVIELIYDSTADRWIERGRNN